MKDNTFCFILLAVLLGICFWMMVGSCSVAFLAYEQYKFENQPPEYAGQIVRVDGMADTAADAYAQYLETGDFTIKL